jgi:hypothetical protein
MPTTEAVVSQLKSLGRGQLDNFNQMELERKAAAGSMPVRGYSPSTGYCHGVCVDWIRRVLQGGRPRFGPNPKRNAKDGYDYYQRRQEQARRQGHAWAVFDAISSRNMSLASAAWEKNQADQRQAQDNRDKVVELLASLATRMLEDFNDHCHLGLAHNVRIAYGAQLARVFPQLRGRPPTTLTVGQLDKLGEQVALKHDQLATQKGPAKKPELPRAAIAQQSYAKFAGHMDARFPNKKRSFEGIALIHVHPDKNYGSASAAVAAVTNPPPTDFKSGRAMIASFGMLAHGEDIGHAIAIHWHPNDFFVLLDPNYGMFIYERLTGPNSVAGALSYLLGSAYNDGATRVSGGMSYEIYAKRND